MYSSVIGNSRNRLYRRESSSGIKIIHSNDILVHAMNRKKLSRFLNSERSGGDTREIRVEKKNMELFYFAHVAIAHRPIKIVSVGLN